MTHPAPSLALGRASGIVALAGGWYFGTAPAAGRADGPTASGTLMFPGLRAEAAGCRAGRDQPSGQDDRHREARRHAGVSRTAASIAVQATKLRGMLTALTELRLVEPRTTDPSEFSRLGLEDPNGKTANSDLLRVLDAQASRSSR